MNPDSIHGTRWTLVQEAKGRTPEARRALADLCALYYAPISAQMRRWLKQQDEADDVTQAFFAHLLAGDHIHGAEAAKGRFRTYLYNAAQHFLISDLRRRKAAKRGASQTLVDVELIEDIALYETGSPDAEFDRVWACSVLQQALTGLENEMAEQNRTTYFKALKPWLSGDASHGDTARVAEELGTSQTAVRVHLSRLRKRLRVHIEAIVAASLAPGIDPKQELAVLLTAFQRG